MKNYKITILILIAILGLFYSYKFFIKSGQPFQVSQSKPTTQSDKPQVTSTKPYPLENAIISANDTIEISFNRPLENVGEFKVRIEPKIDLKIELSSDRKTAKLKPAKPLELGASYTLFIGSDTKFDGVGAWGQEKIFHFRTIQYRGV